MLPIPAVWVLAGHWVTSGAGVIIDVVHCKWRITGHQHPLYVSGKAPSRAFPGQLLFGGGVDAGIKEAAEAVVRERHTVAGTRLRNSSKGFSRELSFCSRHNSYKKYKT